jgi:hypothetical protein
MINAELLDALNNWTSPLSTAPSRRRITFYNNRRSNYTIKEIPIVKSNCTCSYYSKLKYHD